MLSKLNSIGSSLGYWLLVLLLGVALEAVGLYYQYVLNEWPCVLCIQVRIWVLLMILVAFAGLFLRKHRISCGVSHLVVAGIAIGILERAWVLLGTERGTLQAECGIDLGMPTWFAIDKWFPQVFGVWTSCGYTPELFLGITMAEGLLMIFMALALVSLIIALAIFANKSLPGN